MIIDILCNIKLNPIVTELLIRGRKLNIFFDFIMESYLAVPNNIFLYCSTVLFYSRNFKQMRTSTGCF